MLTVAGPATLDTLTLSGGTSVLNGSTTIDELEQTGGVLTGSGTVTVSSLHWTGGTESGIGTTTVSGSGLGLRIDGTAVKTITHRDLVSNGPAGLWQSGTINLTDGGRIVNNGTLHVQAGEAGYALTSSDHSGALVDVGRLDIDAGITVSASLQTEQGSQVELADGTELDLHEADVSGAVTLGADARLQFLGTADEPAAFDAHSTLSGAAQSVVRLVGAGAVTFGGQSWEAAVTEIRNGTLTFDGNASMAELDQTGGTFDANGNLAVGYFHWTGGTEAGTGTTTLTAAGIGLQIDGGGVKTLNGRELVSQDAGASWTGGGDIRLQNHAVLSNTSGTFVAAPSGGAAITSDGTATLDVEGGRMEVGNGFELGAQLRSAANGVVEIAGAEVLQLEGGALVHGGFTLGDLSVLSVLGSTSTFNTDASIQGPGSSTFVSSGELEMSGDYVVGETHVLGGHLTFDSPGLATMSRLGVAGGSVSFDSRLGAGYAGTVRNAGGSITVDGTTLHMGAGHGDGTYVQTAGSTSLIGTSSRLEIADAPAGLVDLQGGIFFGNGTIAGLVKNGATLGPGDGLGTLTITGDYRQTASGTLVTEVGSANQFDQLHVSGTATLDGMLRVAAPRGFTPPADGLALITASRRLGAFTTFQATSTYDIEYRPDAVLLVPVQSCHQAPSHRNTGVASPNIAQPPAGATFGDAVKLSGLQDEGYLSLFPHAARSGDATYVSWLEEGPGIAVQKISDDGTISAARYMSDPGGLGLILEWTWQIAASGPYVYVTWEELTQPPDCGSNQWEVWFAASSDGGQTFSAGRPISAGDDGTENSTPRIAASGRHVSLTWFHWRGFKLEYAGSNDAGAPGTFHRQTLSGQGSTGYGDYDVAASEGNVYVAWSGRTGIGTETGVQVAVSTDPDARDQGAGFTRSILESGDGDLAQVAAAGDDAYVVWNEHTEQDYTRTLQLAASTNDGASFAIQTLATGVQSWGYDIAADGSTVAVAVPSKTQITLERSTDHGGSFSSSFVSPVNEGHGVSLALSGSNVDVAWNDTGRNRAQSLFVAASRDGGGSFEVQNPTYEGGLGSAIIPVVTALRDSLTMAWMDWPTSSRGPEPDSIDVWERQANSADPDLSVTSVTAVQAPDDPAKLVSGKPTVVKAVIRSTMPRRFPVSVRLTYGNGGERTEQILIHPGVNELVLPEGGAPMVPGQGTFPVAVEVDPDNQIAEVDEDNNRLEQSYDVVTTKPLKILYVPLVVDATGEAPPTCGQVAALRSGSDDYLRAAFPIDPGALTSHSNCAAPIHVDLPPSGHLIDGGIPGTGQVLHELDQLGALDGYDETVGIVRPGWFHDLVVKQDGSRSGAIAEAPLGSDDARAAIVEAEAIGGHALAHEWAHNEGWVDSGNPLEDPNHPHHLLEVPAPGYWVGHHAGIPDSTIDFMYFQEVGSGENPTARWISNPTWEYLLSKFETDGGGTHRAATDSSLLAVSGTVSQSGDVSLDPWYRLEGTPSGGSTTGAYSLRFYDGTTLLGETPFDVSFERPPEADGGQTDTASFSLRVPDHPNATRITIEHGGTVLAERQVSAHAPAVTVTSPNGGERFDFGGNFDISWTASDADSDSLAYRVELSRDGGTSWLPLGTTTATFDDDNVDVAINGVWVCRASSIGADRGGVDMAARRVVIDVDLHGTLSWAAGAGRIDPRDPRACSTS